MELNTVVCALCELDILLKKVDILISEGQKEIDLLEETLKIIRS